MVSSDGEALVMLPREGQNGICLNFVAFLVSFCFRCLYWLSRVVTPVLQLYIDRPALQFLAIAHSQINPTAPQPWRQREHHQTCPIAYSGDVGTIISADMPDYGERALSTLDLSWGAWW